MYSTISNIVENQFQIDIFKIREISWWRFLGFPARIQPRNCLDPCFNRAMGFHSNGILSWGYSHATFRVSFWRSLCSFGSLCWRMWHVAGTCCFFSKTCKHNRLHLFLLVPCMNIRSLFDSCAFCRFCGSRHWKIVQWRKTPQDMFLRCPIFHISSHFSINATTYRNQTNCI